MAIIETKYSVGDKVWFAGTTTEAKQHPCPDCKNTRKWTAQSPAGHDYTFACPRCTKTYNSHSDITLTYTAHVPTARQLTIGSVQHNSAPGSYDHGNRYMCVETGVGGGQIYNEDRLFETEVEAMAAAQVMADTANATHPHIVERYNKTLDICDYEIENALLKKAADDASKARSMIWDINDLFSDIEEADDKDAILELIEDYKRYSWERDKKRASEKEAA